MTVRELDMRFIDELTDEWHNPARPNNGVPGIGEYFLLMGNVFCLGSYEKKIGTVYTVAIYFHNIVSTPYQKSPYASINTYDEDWVATLNRNDNIMVIGKLTEYNNKCMKFENTYIIENKNEYEEISKTGVL